MSVSMSNPPKHVLDGLAALKRAAAEARRIAIETNTGIVIVRDGQPVYVSAAELLDQALCDTKGET
jgi:hypothetical protein